MRTLIKHVLAATEPLDAVTVKGWVRTRRDAKGFSFLELNDGSCLGSLQCVVDGGTPGYDQIAHFSTGASAVVEGQLVPSPAPGQKWELRAAKIELIGPADATYPLQKKGHTLEFLRSIAHLRPRSNLFGAVFRVRSKLAYAVHEFFQSRDFVYAHTPIITASDCEGAGAMFRVTTLDPSAPPPPPVPSPGTAPQGSPFPPLFEQDFFNRPTFLTVSGQLEAETFACSLGKCYTFGPTFRAENSNTTRHLAEFWMVEPEMAFFDLADNMDLAERFLKRIFGDVLARSAEDMEFFRQRIDPTAVDTLRHVLESRFVRVSYTEAVAVLRASGQAFEFPVEWGRDLQAEHERYLTETHFRSPVILYDYPRTIKPFYMRLNDDGRTVRAMDVLVPKVGEIIGGSQREERLDVLDGRMREQGLDPQGYWWYRDLRRYGTVPHAGFGLGVERVLLFITGMANIRDVIPFPRAPGSAEF